MYEKGFVTDVPKTLGKGKLGRWRDVLPKCKDTRQIQNPKAGKVQKSARR